MKPEPIGPEVERIKAECGLDSLWLWHQGDHLKLDEIVVPRLRRGQGRGSQAMEQITALADLLGLPVHLVPDSRTAGGAAAKAAQRRLVKWYQRFGFKENKGRRYDFRFRGGMLREPGKEDSR